VVDSKALAVIGVTASAVWAALGPKAEPDKLVQTGIGGDQFVLTPYPWIFKIQMIGQDIAKEQVDFAKSKVGATGKAVAIGYDSPGVRQWEQGITAALKDAGWQQGESQFVTTSTTDFSVVASKIAAENVNAVFSNVLEAQMPNFVST